MYEHSEFNLKGEDWMSFENKGSISTTITVSREPDRSGNYWCTGANDDMEIQLAIDELERRGGGELVVKEGVYDISAMLTVTESDVSIRGVGDGASILSASFDGDMLYVNKGGDRVRFFNISNIQFDENRASRASGRCIHFLDVQDSTIENCYLFDSKDRAVLIEATGAGVQLSLNNTIRNCYAYDNEDIMLELGTDCTDHHIIHNWWGSGPGVAGAEVIRDSGQGNLYHANHVWGVDHDEGIYLNAAGGMNMRVIGNYVESVGETGIYAHQLNDSLINENIIWLVSDDGTGTYDAIRVYDSLHVSLTGNVVHGPTPAARDGIRLDNSLHCSVTGGSITECAGYAVREIGAADYNTILGGAFSGNTTGRVLLLGANSDAAHYT